MNSKCRMSIWLGTGSFVTCLLHTAVYLHKQADIVHMCTLLEIQFERTFALSCKNKIHACWRDYVLSASRKMTTPWTISKKVNQGHTDFKIISLSIVCVKKLELNSTAWHCWRVIIATSQMLRFMNHNWWFGFKSFFKGMLGLVMLM